MRQDSPGLPLLTKFAEDTSGWEDWQRAYRYGLLLIYPPEPLWSLVNALRATYDPRSDAICDAHISLTVPLPRSPSQSGWNELQAVASGIRGIKVVYGPVTHYLPHPGVVLAIQPQDELDGLRALLEATTPFAGSAPRTWPFSAHMTIAEFISVERTQELTEELEDVVPTGEFLCDHVSLAVPDEGFRLEERLRLQLAH